MSLIWNCVNVSGTNLPSTAFIPTIHKSLVSKLTVWGIDWYPYGGRYRRWSDMVMVSTMSRRRGDAQRVVYS
jgi:hypothetical protein